MRVFTLVATGKPYKNEKGTTIEQADFESDDGYIVPFWFNDKMMGEVLKFVQAADGITFDTEGEDLPEINIKDYIGKKVACEIVHGKDNNNKTVAQISDWFTADSVPF